MSVKEYSETFLGHSFWHKDGDKTPWLGEGTTYDGKITVQCDAGDYDESNRTDALVEALTSTKKVIIKPRNGTVSLEIRFRGDGAAGDQHILQCFAAAGVDHYAHQDVLTIDRGSQIANTAGTLYFFDTISSAGETWISATGEVQDAADHMGRWILNTHGCDRFWFVASTLDTATATAFYIDWRRH